MKARYWSLAFVLLLVNYIIFAMLFSKLLGDDFDKSQDFHRTPWPTFTPAPAEPPVIISTPTPFTPVPTPTNTRVLSGEGNVVPSSEEKSANAAQLVALGTINIRSGPGINYGVIGQLHADVAMPVVGRNGSWWQIQINNGALGWVDNSVVKINEAANVPVVEVALPSVKQAAAPKPPTKTQEQEKADPKPTPKYQYEPTGWYNETNKGLTRFLGDIKDANGSPVNGVFVRASCGNYATISFPSGPVGWGTHKEGSDWPAGFYDITVDNKPVPCVWILSVVDTADRQNVKATLSEEIPVEVTSEKSIVVANWRKNW